MTLFAIHNRLFCWRQVKKDSTALLFRTPMELTEIQSQFQIVRILYIAAGGDQSFAIGVTEG
jgi:hypothetical protein